MVSCKFRLRNPSVVLALLVIVLMCSSYVSLLLKVTPKYFALATCSKSNQLCLPKCQPIIYSNMNQIKANPMCYTFNTSLYHVINVEENYLVGSHQPAAAAAAAAAASGSSSSNRARLEGPTSCGNNNARRKEIKYCPLLTDLGIDYQTIEFINLPMSCLGIFGQLSESFIKCVLN